jgi:hypothetical protein
VRSAQRPTGHPVEAFGVCLRDVMVIRSTGDGRRLTIDGRGRLYVPAWVRRNHDMSLVVGTHHAQRTVVVVTPAVFDRVGDALIGREQ